MNWLAHLFLSEQKTDFQMGNILADPLKGRVWDTASFEMIKGMSVHKNIDSFTDKHKVVSNSKKILREKGLLKPVIIDLTYDYLLHKNWHRFCSIDLEDFTNTFYESSSKEVESLPPKAKLFMNNLINKRILNKYKDLEHLKLSFERLDTRLSKRLLQRENASGYYEDVKRNIDKIEEDFLIFFPILCKDVKSSLDENFISHWKI